jgi:hypothetical protein
VTDGENLILNVGGDLTTTAGGVSLTLSTPVDAPLNSGGNLILTVGGDLNIAEGQGLEMSIDNTIFTMVGNGASISAFVGGDVNASFIQINLDNSGNGGIGTGGNLTFVVGGDVNASSLQAELTNVDGGSIDSGGDLLIAAGGNFNASNFSALIDNEAGQIGTGGNMTLAFGEDLNVEGDATFQLLNSGGTIGSDVAVTFSANNVSIGGSLDAYVDNRGGSIGPEENGGSLEMDVSGTLSIGDRLNVLGTIMASDVSAGTLAATHIVADGNIMAGSGGITRFLYDDGGFANVLHVLSGARVMSLGGIDFTGAPDGDGVEINGGSLLIEANSLSFNPEADADIIGNPLFDGGDSSNGAGGDGGSFTVQTSGDISVNAFISATTGRNGPDIDFGGAGGAVDLESSEGTVSVNSTIQVSSDESTSQDGATPPPVRRSSTGGNVNLTGSKPTGVAINVSNSGQLLALLDAAAPGPGGAITILATGASSQANVQGTVQADRGTIDIRHTGTSGQVQIAGVNSDFPANLRADVVKVGALGNNGTLTVGDAFINADTVLKLYAPGSNGELNFIANATLSSGTSAILAANRVTIQPSVVVNIQGAGGPAQVYTNDPNYSGFGGTNPSNGTFGGNGAASPAPLASAPPFDPGSGSGHH